MASADNLPPAALFALAPLGRLALQASRGKAAVMGEDEAIAQSVREHGWHAIAIQGSDAEPPYLYTIGLGPTFGHPEIALFGMEPRFAHGIVRTMVDRIADGQRYTPGEHYAGLLEGYEMAVRAVHPTRHILHLGYAMGFYRRANAADALEAVQVFWPDEAGLFPFEPRCDARVARLQPRLELTVPPSELRAFLGAFN